VTATHPLWRPYEQVTDEQIAAARLPGRSAPERPEVVAPDPAWPEDYLRLARLVRDALGDALLDVQHVGSTSVPGLWAKPLIDVDLVVPDNNDEAAYVPALEAAGCELRVREPGWFGHRLLRSPDPGGNLHVWSPPHLVEPQRHAAFRDWLLTHEDDREAYGDLKRELAAQDFADTMHYNNAKAALIYDIYERVFTADPEHPHDPHPRP